MSEASLTNPPHQHRSHHHHHRHRSTHTTGQKRKRAPSPQAPPTLPYEAHPLSKRDLESYKALFARYLDIQKQLYLEDLDEHEIKGRWKRFVEKWNRKELALGWYDPGTKKRADEEAAAEAKEGLINSENGQRPGDEVSERDGEDDGEDDFGPVPPPRSSTASTTRPSAQHPTLDDLALRDEERANSAARSRKEAHLAEKALTKARLEEILPPKAEPGTKERQLEKKHENAEIQKAYRTGKGESGDFADVGDAELGFGGDDDSGVKRMRREEERRKSERELRREEVRLAKKAEWEERMVKVREREAKNMEGLLKLAKERFG